MEKKEITEELLKDLLSQGFSSYEIGRQLGYTGAGIRYHMKKYDLFSSNQSIQDKQKVPVVNGKKECKKCHNILPIEDFNVKPSGSLKSYCKKCNNEGRYSLLKRRKMEIIQKFGNKCSICGYNKNIAALEFHHIDPNEKEFHLGSTKTTNLDKLLLEMDKCILVCANCHREIHYPNEPLCQDNQV